MRLGPTLERMALELDRLEGNVARARDRALHFQESGAINPARIAERYFPAPQGAVETVGTPNPELRLEVLGETRVGRTALSQMGREFLVTLLEARLEGRAGCSNLELFDALYPGWPDDKSARALKQLVYRLRLALGGGAILRVGNGYALGEQVTSDAETFLQSGDTALWRGPYRADLSADTTSSAAYRLYAALRARILEQNDLSQAARVGAIFLEAHPFDREILKFTLRALETNGQRAAAARLYERARSVYEDVGEILPDDWEDFEVAHDESVQR
jgi:Bacterial transcriptional activator domain